MFKELPLNFCVFADGSGETCPKGFVLDTASYCAGMLLSSFPPHLLFGNSYLQTVVTLPVYYGH